MINAVLNYQFMQNALLASILASVICGIIGVIIVEKELVMMSGGISHTSYGGIGLGYLLGFEPIIGAFIFSVAAALGIGYIKKKGGARTDVIIGIAWALGMALGVLFIAMMPGYPPDISSYLFGNILTVTKSDIWLIAVLTVVVFAVVAILFNTWKTYLFDEEFASVIGIKTGFLDYLIFILIALSVVALIRVVGIILVIALLTIPAATAALLTSRLKGRMLLAVIFSCLYCVAGLWFSYEVNIASGASVVIVSAAGYFIVSVVRIIKHQYERRCLHRS